MAGCAPNLFYQPDDILFYVPHPPGLNFEGSPSQRRWHRPDWLVHSGSRHRRPETGQGTAIHFHGNAQNISAHWRFARWLPQNGYNLFVFDYRGYGTSKGRPHVKGVFEDSRAAIDFVRQRP